MNSLMERAKKEAEEAGILEADAPAAEAPKDTRPCPECAPDARRPGAPRLLPRGPAPGAPRGRRALARLVLAAWGRLRQSRPRPAFDKGPCGSC
jgi:hypothetical protein